MSEDDQKKINYISRYFGWFGGIGDPPDDKTVIAILDALETYPNDPTSGVRLVAKGRPPPK